MGRTDEIFTGTDSSGTVNFLTDGLGSTIGLTNSSGSSVTQYEYEPFGNTTVTAGSSTTEFQYTGRENDGTGLYYNRSRYYHPVLQRFVSEDPIGLRGGTNLVAYAGNNPTSFADPTGLYPSPVCTLLTAGLDFAQVAPLPIQNSGFAQDIAGVAANLAGFGCVDVSEKPDVTSDACTVTSLGLNIVGGGVTVATFLSRGRFIPGPFGEYTALEAADLATAGNVLKYAGLVVDGVCIVNWKAY